MTTWPPSIHQDVTDTINSLLTLAPGSAAVGSVPVVSSTGVVTYGIPATSGFIFYDPTGGWPSSPSVGKLVFYSVGYPSAPAPTTGSNDSVWFFSPS
jgi:hypothetical protein